MGKTGLNVTKDCTKCGESKHSSHFWKDKTKPSGLHSQCKPCAKEVRKKNYCPKRAKGWKLKEKYSITLDKFESMYEDQGGLCKVCNDSERSEEGLCVDHCHTTGTVRGLLCSGCNKALGLLSENADYMINLIEYTRICDEVRKDTH